MKIKSCRNDPSINDFCRLKSSEGPCAKKEQTTQACSVPFNGQHFLRKLCSRNTQPSNCPIYGLYRLSHGLMNLRNAFYKHYSPISAEAIGYLFVAQRENLKC